MKFARVVFPVAGIYGLIVLAPRYFLEAKTGRDFPPPITHPEFYYGFIGVTIGWQVLFLFLSTDPTRYRPLMIPAVLEKASFAIAIAVLFLLHRVPSLMLAPAAADLILGVLFTASYVKTHVNERSVRVETNSDALHK
jgi:hypothetical protein